MLHLLTSPRRYTPGMDKKALWFRHPWVADDDLKKGKLIRIGIKGPVLVVLFVVIPIFAFLLWTRQLPILLHNGMQWGIPFSLFIGLS